MHRDELTNAMFKTFSATHTLPIDAVLLAWRVKLFHARAMWHGLVQTCCCSVELFAWLDNIIVGGLSCKGITNHAHSPAHACAIMCARHLGDAPLATFGISVPRLGYYSLLDTSLFM